MKHSIFITAIVAGILVVAVATPVRAQAPAAAPDASEIGKQLATAGAPGIAACASCHGARGEGNAATNFPRIAGQGEGYLARQLNAYADGSRVNPVMSPIAKAMNRQQIDAVSLYYAALEAPAAPSAAKPSDKAITRGRTLANIGDEAIGVQGCANCHGPGGIGEPPNYPYLASQFHDYLTVSLGEWKKGTRKTDPSGVMNIVARRMSDEDINAVSAYFSAQPAPPPAAKRVVIAAGTAARPVAPSPAPGAQQPVPAQGVGIESGAPTTGGGQGPGGGGGASGAGPQGSPAAPPQPGTSGGGTSEQQSQPVQGVGVESGAPTTGGGQGPGGGGGASGAGPQGSPAAPLPPGTSGGGTSEQQSQPVQGVGVESGAPTTGGGQGPGGGGGASGSGPQGSPAVPPGTSGGGTSGQESQPVQGGQGTPTTGGGQGPEGGGGMPR